MDIVEYLTEKKAKHTLNKEGMFPLDLCISSGKIKILGILLLNCINVDFDHEKIKRIAGNTNYPESARLAAFRYLIAKGTRECVEELILHIELNKWDPNVLLSTESAIRGANLPVLKWLSGFYGLDKECVLWAVGSGQIEILSELIKPKNQEGFGFSIDVRDKNGTGAVLMAIVHGKVDMLKKLIQPVSEGGFGLSLNVSQDAIGLPILSSIVYGKKKMLDFLVKEIGYNVLLQARDPDGYDAVLLAVANGHVEMLKKLLRTNENGGYGLSLNSRINDADGVIAVASANKQLAMITELAISNSEYLSSLPIQEIQLAMQLTENDSKAYLAYFNLLERTLNFNFAAQDFVFSPPKSPDTLNILVEHINRSIKKALDQNEVNSAYSYSRLLIQLLSQEKCVIDCYTLSNNFNAIFSCYLRFLF